MDRLTAALSLRYGSNKVDDESWHTEGLGSSLSYGWLWKQFNFSSNYRFFAQKDERRGDSNEHRFEFNMTTSKIRIGTLYLNYVFFRSDENYQYLEKGSEDSFDEGSVLKYESTTTGNILQLGIGESCPEEPLEDHSGMSKVNIISRILKESDRRDTISLILLTRGFCLIPSASTKIQLSSR